MYFGTCKTLSVLFIVWIWKVLVYSIIIAILRRWVFCFLFFFLQSFHTKVWHLYILVTELLCSLCTWIIIFHCFRKQYLKRPQKNKIKNKNKNLFPASETAAQTRWEGFSLAPKGRLFANSCWNSVGVGCWDTKHHCLQLNMTLPNPLHSVPTTNCIWALTSNHIFFHINKLNKLGMKLASNEREIMILYLFSVSIKARNTLGSFLYKTILI